MTAKIISITNQKGGVGKTTTSVNLAACLTEKKYKVLLIDLDPQGQAGEHLGVGPQDNTILDVLTSKKEISECIVKSYRKNLDLLQSNLNLGSFNQQNSSANQFILKKSLEQVKDKYDYIIVDCQPSLSLLTLNALVACNYVILPVQAEYFALDGLTQLIYTLKEIQKKLHPELKVLGILITMFDKRNRLSSEVKNELFKNFEDELFQTVISRNVKLAESPSFGKAIIDYDSSSNGADNYRNLTKEVISRTK